MRAGRTPLEGRLLPDGLPHVAYVVLWYPLFTQPFIFREVEGLRENLPMTVYSLYGKNLRNCSAEMRLMANRVFNLGVRALPRILFAALREFIRHPVRSSQLFRRSLFHRWGSLEILGENLWGFFAGMYLGQLFRDGGIDMVYAPWPRGAATAAWVAASIAGLPFAISARGDNIAPADPDLVDKLGAALFVRTNNAADTARIEALAPRTRGKIDLVYNSLSLPRVAGCALGHAHEHGAPLRLLALGRFDVTKGFDILLKACALLRDRGIPFTLTLAGGGGRMLGLGGLENELIRLCSELRLEGLVTMPGVISHNDLPGVLAGHDVFVAPCVVHPSGRRDGIPNTIIEAMSSGIPVIATTVNALPEVVHDGENGLTVPPGDPAALADAIARLANEPAEASRLGKNGAAFAREMFNPVKNSQKLADLFTTHYQRWKSSCVE